MKILNVFVIFLSVFILIIFNWNALNSYFSQDDFFHLRLLLGKEITDLPSLFIPKFSDEQTFYRPLSRELYNFIMFKLYNLNPFPYHLINLVLIFINSFLVFLLIKMVSKKELIGFLAFLIYLISPIHSVELYYLSSVQTLLSTFFVLVGLLNYHKFSTGRKIINWYLSILVFITALLSHESAAVLIGILFLYEVFCKKNSFRRIVINLLPFVLLLFLRILVHFAYFGISQQQVYQPVFSPPSVINSFVWLSLWTIGLPEMLRDFMTLKFEINPNLFKYYGDYLLLITPIIGIILITVAIAFGRYFRNLNSIFYFLFFSFIISLTPFIFFPKHIFSYYLNLPLVFFAGFIVYPISNLLTWQKIGKFVVIFFVVAFLGLSWQTIQLNQSTHWAAKRAKAAKVILSSIKHEVPQIDKGANFFIKDDPGYPYISQDWGSSSKQVFYILSGSDALKLLYNDLSIKVYYEAIDSEKYNQEKMISLTPFFPY